MKNKSHLPEILLHLLIVMVLPLAAITAVSKVVEIAGIKPDWCDAVVLLLKTAVMVNVAIHVSTTPRRESPLSSFQPMLRLATRSRQNMMLMNMTRERQSRKLSRKLRAKSQRQNILITMQMSSRKPI